MTAVEKGNSAAEVLLAGLYLRGDGVAKSCEQGRVLLQSASKSGNAEADAKLDELNANGCP
jgi:TPR repeat protein